MISVQNDVCFARKLQTEVASVHVFFRMNLDSKTKMPFLPAVDPPKILVDTGTGMYMESVIMRARVEYKKAKAPDDYTCCMAVPVVSENTNSKNKNNQPKNNKTMNMHGNDNKCF